MQGREEERPTECTVERDQKLSKNSKTDQIRVKLIRKPGKSSSLVTFVHSGKKARDGKGHQVLFLMF